MRQQTDERVLADLRELYSRYGYRRYKVTRFEEYDLYVRNKNFLVSDQMLTFTDTNGRLMALKPDITLSIVKNARPTPGQTEKVFYAEKVYRASDGCNGFQEITQTGLECIGDLDAYTVCEVLQLACGSLAAIGERYVLQLSHLGIMDSLLREVPEADRGALLETIRAKNLPALKTLCRARGLAPALTERLLLLAEMSGPLHRMLPELKPLLAERQSREALEELTIIDETMESCGLGERIYLDFSVISDLNYYNGIVFQGYVDGLASHILSGGRYDRLMERMGKQAGGIGFAVYASMLERFDTEQEPYDGDVLLLYDETTPVSQVAETVRRLTEQGKTVRAAGQVPETLRFRETMVMRNGGNRGD